MSLVSASAQHISCNIMRKDGTCSCLVSFIYALNSVYDRRLLWSDLISLQESQLIKENKRPWCLLGDFNSFLYDFETNRNMPRRCTSTVDFQNCCHELSVTDLRFNGPIFTWWDSSTTDSTMKKLDRVLVNEGWLDLFDLSQAEFLPRGLSDHSPATVNFGVARDRVFKPFQLFQHLLDREDFISVVAQAWDFQVRGDAWFRLTTKLKRVKSAFKDLNYREGNVHNRVETARNALLSFQASLPDIPSHSFRIEEGRLSSELQLALLDEEKFLRQKSRVKWLKYGDGCNTFFFNSCKDRWNSNKILRIVDDAGNEHVGHSNIASVAVEYFKSLYGSCNLEPCPDLNSLAVLSDGDQLDLVAQFTPQDVLSTFKSMAKGKSPGPDGFPAEFFIKAWEIVGSDTTDAILWFFDSGHLPRIINSSAIVLIPKQANASHMNQFRRISCCNVLYKCISKMLAHRMQAVMSSLISSNQAAFVPNRNIGDNIFLAQALCRDYHQTSGPSRFSCKLDIRKAFDTVSWEFIFNVLTAMRFPPQFISWIRICITTCKHSVKINGALEGYFSASAGLRQGDPLSPYLFVFSMEVLNVCMNHVINDRVFSHHWRCSEQKITHLAFADDLLLFSKGDSSSIFAVLDAVSMFSSISGLSPNPAKCTCYFGNIDIETKLAALDYSGFIEGSLPVMYLGIPLVSRNLTVRDCQPLITRICKRISIWTSHFISQAGRLQLINAILFAIQGFWAGCIFLPNKVIKAVQGVFARYLWTGSLTSRGVYKVSWSDCCYPKDEGGIGIKNLSVWSTAAILFQLWRIINKEDSIWIEWLYKYELKKKGFWTMRIPYKCSWSLRRILHGRTLASRFIRYVPGRSSMFLFWHDPWLLNSPLSCRFDDSLLSALELDSMALLQVVRNSGQWNFGVSNYSLVREIRQECTNIMIANHDSINWNYGVVWPVKISTIYADLSTHNAKPPWFSFVWHNFNPPRYAFYAWLIIKERLLTKDRMISFHMNTDAKCLLCQLFDESHEHLFCYCPFVRIILDACPVPVSHIWADYFNGNCLLSQVDPTRRKVAYLYISASFYHLWAERNLRLHNPGNYSPASMIIKLIKENVRSKLFSCISFQAKLRTDVSLLSCIY